jgi:hypothetical protein
MSGSNLFMDDTGILDINSTLSLSGDLIFGMQDESRWSWGADSALEMTGGVGSGVGQWDQWSSQEIGGFDFGDDPINHVGNPSGFSNNFDLEKLVIGAAARVYLNDLVDNGNRGGLAISEALYVDVLEFADVDGLLNINGLHLYYNTLIGDPSQIIDTAVPLPPAVLLLGSGLLFLLGMKRRRRY